MIEINVFKAMIEKAGFTMVYEENYYGDTEIQVVVNKDKIYNRHAKRALTELLINSEYSEEDCYYLDVYEIRGEETFFTEVIWSIE